MDWSFFHKFRFWIILKFVKNVTMLFNNQNTPRILILAIDLFIIFTSTIIAFLLRFNFHIPASELILLPKAIILILAIRLASFLISRSFSGIIRYTEAQDVVRIFLVTTIGTFAIAIADYALSYYFDVFIIPRAVVIIEFISSTMFLIAFRLAVKVSYAEFFTNRKGGQNILIFGAGEAAIFAKKAIDSEVKKGNKVVGFIDDDQKKSGKKLDNTLIYSADKFGELLNSLEVDQVIISIQNISNSRKQEIINCCIENKVKVSHIPPVSKWINGELSLNQIKDIQIVDLLEREEINLDNDLIESTIKEKVVLVSGAAGSIGSEICRQIIKYKPAKLILLDQAETPLYYLELELAELSKVIEVVIGNTRNQARMQNLFDTFKPQIVFHAAAYKHVPLMENNPSEAVSSNVKGTAILANLSIEYGVEKFIMVSTDKAVNPTNVMGATKRIAELYVQALNEKKKTKFITTRFGNVLGSNGSVIPLFTKQIQNGGPITLTHPEITRYFMTIPEACQLVLQAGAFGIGGEIFVFDMGKSVKIIDLAKKMISLSGLELGKDIQIIYTGLRPGEKLYEELLTDEENNLPTHHQKIMKAKAVAMPFEVIKEQVDQLIALFETQDNKAIVQKMKSIVPEYLSNNSIFEKLDR